MFEGGPNFEIPTREEVIESLIDYPDDLSKFIKYFESKEASVQTSRDDLVINIEKSEIYRDAGLTEFAIEAFEQAAEQAICENDMELYRKLIEERNELL